MRAVGVDLTGLAVLSGAIGVGLGFGLQKVVSNLVSGVIILLDKSIKPGDVIEVDHTDRNDITDYSWSADGTHLAYVKNNAANVSNIWTGCDDN